MASRKRQPFYFAGVMLLTWAPVYVAAQDVVQETSDRVYNPSLSDAVPGPYLVGPQDVLRVTVFEEPGLTGLFTVDPDGTLAFPLIDRITVGGRALREIEVRLVERLLDGYLRYAQVKVEVEQYGSQKVYVLGEVRTPGVVSLTGNMTLFEVLVKAGSTTEDAGNLVQIVRSSGARAMSGPVLPQEGIDTDRAEVTAVDLRDIRTGQLSQVTVRNGDTVYVPKAARFFVTGNVRDPGAFVWERGITVLQAVALAGGVTERGSTRGIKILRVVDNSRREISADMKDPVEPGDTIRVRQRYF